MAPSERTKRAKPAKKAEEPAVPSEAAQAPAEADAPEHGAVRTKAGEAREEKEDGVRLPSYIGVHSVA